jgi:hypothetical protein
VRSFTVEFEGQEYIWPDEFLSQSIYAGIGNEFSTTSGDGKVLATITFRARATPEIQGDEE